ncbi:hypothetical protein J7E73_21855 [Paenibacillus albidus]|uniref:hypothetical protein n=1 Tax=Paenibacillus albidus TaxID=2041023 RepID=UPI001BEA4686|nr:hypothetical protein [Paenibacillus albidus]MBT2291722.1 hypothetical protein [Paenibacillus albidus]
MNENMGSAKVLFNRYLGSKSAMYRGGDYEVYNSCGISDETEQEWFKELIDRTIAELSIRDWGAITSLVMISSVCKDSLSVEKAAAFAARNIKSADSMVRLIFGEQLVELIRANKIVLTRDSLFEASRTALQTLENVIAEPLILDPGHELAQFQVKDKRALNQRAGKSIEALKELIN